MRIYIYIYIPTYPYQYPLNYRTIEIQMVGIAKQILPDER